MGYLKKEEYMDIAPASAGTTHANHENCPAGTDTKRRLYVTRKEDGCVVAYCHNCGCSGANKSTSRFRNSGTRKALDQQPEKLVMPSQYTFDPEEFPPIMEEYLKRYHIDLTTAREYGIGYDAETGSIITTKWDQHLNLVQFQTRKLVPDGGPKYMTYKEKGAYTHSPVIPLHSHRYEGTCVIVEDMLSAICCAKQGIPAIPLFGTHCPDEVYIDIKDRGISTIIVWLDNDNDTVIKCTNNIVRKGKLLGFNMITIDYRIHEPKHYSMMALAAILESTICDA